MKCRCGSEIPETRIRLGYTECVGCSSVERVGVVDVVYHKTGNTIEITTGEIADRIRKLSRRSGFGTMKCLGAKRSDTYNPKNIRHGVSMAQVGSQAAYERVGEACMLAYDERGLEEALAILDRAVRDYEINGGQGGRIRRVLLALEAGKKPQAEKPIIRYHAREEKENRVVGEDIEFMFRNWRR